MRKFAFLWTVLMILAFQVGPLTHAQADVVGHITQVEGRVDLLKGGKLPATPVALQDKVESGDVLRTKSLSKAQITFIDNSVITLSPESRLAVDEYRFDPAQQKRNAVLNLFQGMAHVVVNTLFKVEEPDFVIKTHTAVTGVRGTDFGVRLQPNASTILNFEGVTQVGNIFPEVSQLFRRAAKIAFAWSGGGGQWVTLNNMQGTTVARGLPPTLPYGLTSQDRDMFMRQLNATAPTGAKAYQGQELARGATAMPTGPLSSTTPVSTIAQGEQTTLAILNTITVSPTVVPPMVMPPALQPQPTPTPTSGVAIPAFNILTAWGAGATDLDLHLTGPQVSSIFHVYYANSGSLTTQPYALLHADALGTSGSEVITVQQFNKAGLTRLRCSILATNPPPVPTCPPLPESR